MTTVPVVLVQVSALMSRPTSSSNPAGGLLKTSVASASSLMALQLLSRGFTFILNQALFRLASPAAFGAAAIQFELVLSTILFLSREGVRNALLRVNKDASPETTTRRMNLTFIPIGIGIPLALATSFLYARFAAQEMKLQPHFEAAIALYAIAAVAELCSEPLYNVFVSTISHILLNPSIYRPQCNDKPQDKRSCTRRRLWNNCKEHNNVPRSVLRFDERQRRPRAHCICRWAANVQHIHVRHIHCFPRIRIHVPKTFSFHRVRSHRPPVVLLDC